MPWLYLKGVSTGQFAEALTALLGPEAPGLSPATVRRLTQGWHDEHERWQRRDLSARRYAYLWADGVYFTPRLEHERQCLLVLIGADAPVSCADIPPGDRAEPDGRKELLAVEDGFRESAQSWRELLLRLRDENGLALDPELATGDGALGFWQALHEIWPKTRQQRCWVHKTANVLNKLPASLQGKAKQDLHAIHEAANRKEAEQALDRFVVKYGAMTLVPPRSAISIEPVGGVERTGGSPLRSSGAETLMGAISTGKSRKGQRGGAPDGPANCRRHLNS